MAKRIELEIEISPDGKVMFHVMGVKGPACLDYVDLMKLHLGQLVSLDKTSEFYETGQVDTQDQIKRSTSID